jgi:hypothetical protein
MDKSIVSIFLFACACIIIGLLLVTIFDEPKKIKVYNENIPNSVPSNWWGYGWRPWWRQYGGVPGFDSKGEGKPLPEPTMPVAPKPIVIDTK